jgi:hypothetical protein
MHNNIYRRRIVYRKGLFAVVSLMIGCWLAVCVNCDNGTGPNGTTKPLELVAPKGGGSYQVGQTVEVKWKINDANKISSVGIKLSLDNGKSYLGYDLEPESIFPPTTSFSWTITDDQVSTQCILKIYDYIDNSINDKSSTFTIAN